jgi:hypothetical protein
MTKTKYCSLTTCYKHRPDQEYLRCISLNYLATSQNKELHQIRKLDASHIILYKPKVSDRKHKMPSVVNCNINVLLVGFTPCK